VRDFAFVQQSNSLLPKRNRLLYAAVAGLHVLLLALIAVTRSQPTRVNSAGSSSGSIATYVTGSVGGSAAAPAGPVQRKKPPTTTPMRARAVSSQELQPQQDAQPGSGAVGTAGTGQGSGGPVRLGNGGSLTLLKKVQPVYPPMMQSARVPGAVVLDAVIHADGTIGEITVVRATNGAFAQSAVAAVKQWRYAPPGFEGLLTVNVNFTLPG